MGGVERAQVTRLLEQVATGSLSPDAAAGLLERARPASDRGWTDLGYARVDTDRARRTGDPEVVYGAGKTPEQAVGIVAALRDADPGRATLVTRADAGIVAALQERWPDLRATAPGPGGACVTVGPVPQGRGEVVVVSAGTSDGPVSAEALATVEAFGARGRRVDDVGVAGLHRLLAVVDDLAAADCLVVVAGMEGALPSVVGGLVGVPLVAVPTSVGYGAGLGGITALLAMLSSCSPGVGVVNVDNGFGAGVLAARIARSSARAAAPSMEAS